MPQHSPSRIMPPAKQEPESDPVNAMAKSVEGPGSPHLPHLPWPACRQPAAPGPTPHHPRSAAQRWQGCQPPPSATPGLPWLRRPDPAGRQPLGAPRRPGATKPGPGKSPAVRATRRRPWQEKPQMPGAWLDLGIIKQGKGKQRQAAPQASHDNDLERSQSHRKPQIYTFASCRITHTHAQTQLLASRTIVKPSFGTAASALAGRRSPEGGWGDLHGSTRMVRPVLPGNQERHAWMPIGQRNIFGSTASGSLVSTHPSALLLSSAFGRQLSCWQQAFRVLSPFMIKGLEATKKTMPPMMASRSSNHWPKQ